ncbi:MAG: patatin-like phospholipase family protein, partial [Duncaniella sp.]|nr:patatin-like phospholipase family protein [Duncaniella sp.]
MGAIVGSLYASGFTPAEMIALIASPGFADWSTGQINPDYLYYFLSEQQTPSLVRINLGKDSTSVKSVLPMSLINPIPMNMAFLDIYSRYTAQCEGDFNKLFVPFRCCTSDVYAKHKVVLSHGSLADAVRMSMSFPMIFEPIMLNGVPMYDGGIYDNYPVDVMVEDFNPRWLIGVNVGSKNAPPGTRDPMDQLEDMIMQPNNYPFPTDKGVNIRIDLDEFGLLDFGKYQAIYDIGYRRGLEMMDSIRAMIPVRADEAAVRSRREDFKRATPEMRISHVNVTGGTPSQNAYLESLFEPRKGHDTLTFEEARDAYYRAISSDKLQNFVPTPVYNPADSTFTLNYRAIVKENYTLGIGGYVSTSTNSMLFFHTGYHSLGFNSLNANVNAWLGQSYMAAEGEFKWYFNTAVPSAWTVRVVGSRLKYHETEKLFYELKSPDFIRRSEFFVRSFYSLGPSLRSRVDIQLGWGHLTDRYHSDLEDEVLLETKDTGIFNLWQGALRWECNTLDDNTLPTSGTRVHAIGMAVGGKYHLDSYSDEMPSLSRLLKWLQIDLGAEHYWALGRSFSVGTGVRALLSTRKLLPTYQASIVAAEALHPTPSSYNTFSPSLRANSFVNVQLEPVWKITDSFQVRGTVDG